MSKSLSHTIEKLFYKTSFHINDASEIATFMLLVPVEKRDEVFSNIITLIDVKKSKLEALKCFICYSSVRRHSITNWFKFLETTILLYKEQNRTSRLERFRES